MDVTLEHGNKIDGLLGSELNRRISTRVSTFCNGLFAL